GGALNTRITSSDFKVGAADDNYGEFGIDSGRIRLSIRNDDVGSGAGIVVSMGHNSHDGYLSVRNRNQTTRVDIENGKIFINSVQVLGSQQPHIANAGTSNNLDATYN